MYLPPPEESLEDAATYAKPIISIARQTAIVVVLFILSHSPHNVCGYRLDWCGYRSEGRDYDVLNLVQS